MTHNKGNGKYPVAKTRDGAEDDVRDLLEIETPAMLKAFLDESSHSNKDTKLLAIAGYIASVNNWSRLGMEWNNILRSYNIKHGLHMKEFAHFKGEFEQFKNDERRVGNFSASLFGRSTRKDASLRLDAPSI